MTATAHANHTAFDHRRCWSRTGRDGSCLGRGRRARRGDQQPLSSIDVAAAIGPGSSIVPPSQPDHVQPRRRAAPPAPTTTTKSP